MQKDLEIWKILDKLAEVEFLDKTFYVDGKKIIVWKSKNDKKKVVHFFVNIDGQNVKYERIVCLDKENEVYYEKKVDGKLKKQLTKKYEDRQTIEEQYVIAPEIAEHGKIYINNSGNVEKIAYNDCEIYQNEGGLTATDKKSKQQGFFNGNQYFIIDDDGKVLTLGEMKEIYTSLANDLITICNNTKQFFGYYNLHDQKFLKQLELDVTSFMNDKEEKINFYFKNKIFRASELLEAIKKVRKAFTNNMNDSLTFKGSFIEIFNKEVDLFIEKNNYEKRIEELSNLRLENLNEEQKQYVLRKLGVFDTMEDDCK